MYSEFIVTMDTNADIVRVKKNGEEIPLSASVILLTRILGIAKKNESQQVSPDKVGLYDYIDSLIIDWNLSPKEDYVYKPGEKLTTGLQSGECVYFVKCDKLYPGMIKIGRTRNLQKRTEKLYFDNLQSPCELFAFVKTKDAVQLENAFHKLFQEHCFEGEYFYEKAVLWYLSTKRAS